MAEFITLTKPSVITEFAMQLVAWRGDHYDPFGSAVLIRQNLLLTARHVFEDYIDKFHPEDAADASHKEFACMALQELTDGRFVQHKVQKVFSIASSDIALLLIDGPTTNALGNTLPGLTMTMLAPPVGSAIRAFGYHDCAARVEGDNVTIARVGSTSLGSVMELHHDRRDSQLHWPCFRIDARFDGGMSGGPVFNERGELCGLVCKGMPPYPPEHEYVSYVTTLWPMLTVMLDVPRLATPGAQSRYPALDLARDGSILARHWDRASLICSDDGDVVEATFRHD